MLASRIVCLIVIAWFIAFAAEQSKAATKRQVGELGGTAQHGTQQQAGSQRTGAQQTGAQSAGRADGKRPAKHGSARRLLDEVAKAVTSPFSRLTSGTSSAWLAHGADTLLALLVYGVGVGFLARFVRLRL